MISLVSLVGICQKKSPVVTSCRKIVNVPTFIHPAPLPENIELIHLCVVVCKKNPWRNYETNFLKFSCHKEF